MAEFTQSKYGNTVSTIELINEPFPYTASELKTLQNFYKSAYTSVRQSGNVVIAIDEAFQGLPEWEGFMTTPQWSYVAVDTVCKLGVKN